MPRCAFLRTGAFLRCRERARADMESAPTALKNRLVGRGLDPSAGRRGRRPLQTGKQKSRYRAYREKYLALTAPARQTAAGLPCRSAPRPPWSGWSRAACSCVVGQAVGPGGQTVAQVAPDQHAGQEGCTGSGVRSGHLFSFPHTLADSKYRFAQTLYTGFQME